MLDSQSSLSDSRLVLSLQIRPFILFLLFGSAIEDITRILLIFILINNLSVIDETRSIPIFIILILPL